MTSFSVRLSLFFAAIFLVIGVAMPYLPVWLESRGLSGAEIGVVVAVPMVMRVVFTPLMAVAAGRFATLSRAIAIFALLGTIPILAIHQASGFAAIVLAVGLSALFWNPVLPLTEALALAGVRRGSASYGRMRLWGSWSFIAANLGGGWILARIHPEQTIVIIAASYVACAAAAWALREPDMRPDEPPIARSSSVRDAAGLLKMAPLVLALLATALLQASHGLVYTMGSIHWASAGLGYTAIGGLWAIGVLAEIALFAGSSRIGVAFGATGLLLMASGAGVIRWTAFAFEPGLAALVLLQILHGFTFGAAHLGVVKTIADTVPERHAPAAQALYFTLGGLALGLSSLASGSLYEIYGAKAYAAMAALSLAGGIVAIASALAQGLTPKATLPEEGSPPR